LLPHAGGDVGGFDQDAPSPAALAGDFSTKRLPSQHRCTPYTMQSEALPCQIVSSGLEVREDGLPEEFSLRACVSEVAQPHVDENTGLLPRAGRDVDTVPDDSATSAALAGDFSIDCLPGQRLCAPYMYQSETLLCENVRSALEVQDELGPEGKLRAGQADTPTEATSSPSSHASLVSPSDGSDVEADQHNQDPTQCALSERDQHEHARVHQAFPQLHPISPAAAAEFEKLMRWSSSVEGVVPGPKPSAPLPGPKPSTPPPLASTGLVSQRLCTMKTHDLVPVFPVLPLRSSSTAAACLADHGISEPQTRVADSIAPTAAQSSDHSDFENDGALPIRGFVSERIREHERFITVVAGSLR
jgi:hypothetical protein